MPAIAMHGASLPTYSHYFARAQGGPDQKMSNGFAGNGVLQQSLPLNSNWSIAGPDKYGLQTAFTWPSGNFSSGLPPENPANQLFSVPKGWRNGDWICSCGFHNYSSRGQCKKCNASLPPALGTKRLASDEFSQDWDNKRLNTGHLQNHFMPNGHQSYTGYDPWIGSSGGDPKSGVYTSYPSLNSGALPNSQVPLQFPPQTPILLGKGAKQWRDGDWMCNNCNNHNYATRSSCNRCKSERDAVAQPALAV